MDQKREVRAAMSSPSVVKALETGIPKEAIEMAIKDRLLAGNGTYRTVVKLNTVTPTFPSNHSLVCINQIVYFVQVISAMTSR